MYDELSDDLLFEANPQPMWIYDSATLRFLAVNDMAVASYGYSHDEFLAMTLADIRPPEDVSALKETLPLLPLEITHSGCWRHRKRDGSVIWVETISHGCRFRNHHARLVISNDVTERKRAEDALLKAERDYRAIFENAVEGIFQTTPEGRYLRANPALARIYGYESPMDLIAGLTDIKQQLYVDPQRRAEFVQQMQVSHAVTGFEAQVYRKDGSVTWISENARPVRDAEGALLYFEGTVEDITARKVLEADRDRRLQEALERADHDPLTGLLNHRAFHTRLEEEAFRADRERGSVAIAMMDMDNFKFFNDAYGHTTGDEVLRQVADVLRACCRPYDVPARFGGDEFALLMPNLTYDQAARRMEQLLVSLAEIGFRPRGADGAIPLTLSIGVAIYPEDGTGWLDVVSTADIRLLRAKTGGSEDEYVERVRAGLSRSVVGFSMLDALVTAVDNKDRYTRRHSEDVMQHSLRIARELGLDAELLDTVQVAALLHDVGKIGVPDYILRKPTRLPPAEFEAIKQHPIMGVSIVGAVPGFEATLDAIRHHHERWDGGGYPYGLHGMQIPLLARLMAVADAFSAITTDRPYHKGRRPEEALAMLAAGAGTQWDPVCVDAFLRAYAALPARSSTIRSVLRAA